MQVFGNGIFPEPSIKWFVKPINNTQKRLLLKKELRGHILLNQLMCLFRIIPI